MDRAEVKLNGTKMSIFPWIAAYTKCRFSSQAATCKLGGMFRAKGTVSL